MKGLNKFSINLKRVMVKLESETDSRLNYVATDLLREAIRRTPIRTGRLRRSGRIVKKTIGKRKIKIVEFTAPYGVRVHEVTGITKGIIGKKFLYRAFREKRHYYKSILAKKVRVKR